MPITQERMISLIDAAESILNQYDCARQLIIEVAESQFAEGGPIKKANALLSKLPPEVLIDENLREAVREIMNARQALLDLFKEHLPIPIEHMRTLMYEKAHFKINAKRNLSNRKANASYRERQKSEEDSQLKTKAVQQPEAERDPAKWARYEKWLSSTQDAAGAAAKLDPELAAASAIDSREAYEAERAARRAKEEAEDEDDELA